MIVELLHNLYNYNAWANVRILDTAVHLSLEQLRVEARANFGSIHGTLVHMMSAQWVWLARWQGISPSEGF